MIKIRKPDGFTKGYNSITTMNEAVDDTMMDFGILKMEKGQVEVISESEKEVCLLLVYGEVELQFEGKTEVISRTNCFDENPCVLHVAKGVEVKITNLCDDTEINVTMTTNEKSFPSKLYLKEDCRSEERGKGTLRETSTRIVRTVFDYSNAPYSNLVIGEVINFPGKWSSYPPHHHPQPEIYYYKFMPENGYGFCQLGDDGEQVKTNDTVKILNSLTHPQATAPGYAMYYIWVIRHIDGNPYKSPEYPIFESEHTWVMKSDAVIWPEK